MHRIRMVTVSLRRSYSLNIRQIFDFSNIQMQIETTYKFKICYITFLKENSQGESKPDNNTN